MVDTYLTTFLNKYRDTTPLFKTALTHRSASSVNNERLEHLGDAVLDLVVAETLYLRQPDLDEGQLTRVRAHLVRKETLTEIALNHDLGSRIILGPGEMKSGGQRRGSILANTLEAIIGAIYLTHGIELAREFILNIYDERLRSLPNVNELKDPKTSLQEFLQSKSLSLPTYTLLSVNNGNTLFSVECRVDATKHSVVGEGSSRQKAEQDAARKLMSLILQQ